METSRLSMFHAYDYYHTTASKRELAEDEARFFNFCMEHHDIICDEETEDNHSTIVSATELYLTIA